MEDARLDDRVEDVVLLDVVLDDAALQQVVAQASEDDLVAELHHLLAVLAVVPEDLLRVVAEEVRERTDLRVDDVVREEVVRLEDLRDHVAEFDHALLLLDLLLRIRLQALDKLNAHRAELLEAPLLLEGHADVFGDLLHVRADAGEHVRDVGHVLARFRWHLQGDGLGRGLLEGAPRRDVREDQRVRRFHRKCHQDFIFPCKYGEFEGQETASLRDDAGVCNGCVADATEYGTTTHRNIYCGRLKSCYLCVAYIHAHTKPQTRLYARI